MKAILFARVSTQEQMKEGYSISAQMEQMRKHCHAFGLSIFQEHEVDESSTKEKRAKFDCIISTIEKQQEPIALIVETIDRLLRRFRELPKIEQLIERGKLELHCLREHLCIKATSTSDIKMRLHMGVMMANSYVNQLSDNVKRSIQQKITEGRWIAKAPFGYKNVSDERGKKEIEIDPLKSAIVRRMFHTYASGSESMDGLRASMKKEFGAKFSKGQIDAILKNPFYYGMMRVKGELHPHRYNQIVKKSIFDKVQEIKAGYQKKKYKYAGLQFFYRGLIKCGTCGCAVTPETKKNKYVYYHCTGYNGKHDAHWVREENLTDQFSTVFSALNIPHPLADLIVARLNESRNSENKFRDLEFDQLKRQQTKLNSRIHALYADKLDQKIDEQTYLKYFEEYQSELIENAERLKVLEEEESEQLITLARLNELTENASKLFLKSGIELRRKLIKLTMNNLGLSAQKLVFDLSKAFVPEQSVSGGLRMLQ